MWARYAVGGGKLGLSGVTLSKIPKTAKVDRRERTVLTDDELVRYVAWEHPEEKKRPAVLER